jgi:integrase
MRLTADSEVSKGTKKLLLTCDCGCGEQFWRYKKDINSRNYFNGQHRAAARQRECTEAQCGPYLDPFNEYIEGPAARLYRDLRSVRLALRPFFLFLNTNDIVDLQDVTSARITAFQRWGIANGYAKAAKDTSALSTFFKWARVEGRYVGDSPVVPSLHGKRNKPRVGQPYTTEETCRIRELLEERGNERLRAFFEIAAESGMRAREICRLQLHHVSLEKKELFVGVPNKAQTERKAFFYTRAQQRVREWLKVRTDCGHDFLFHNQQGKPLKYDSIRREFQQALCLKARGKVCNETGLQQFSIHRLRHTNSSTLASNGADATTLVYCLGWASSEPISGYTRIDEDSKKRSFVETMTRVEEKAGDEQTQVLSPEEFLLSIGA